MYLKKYTKTGNKNPFTQVLQSFLVDVVKLLSNMYNTYWHNNKTKKNFCGYKNRHKWFTV